ncbi:G protein alpha subunit f [Choristoneura fumiferana]|uniref:G protein alpha subunit f n=1 Tax=Choristoneura fumiferana TaxID=7141 RepID=UPI003D154F13
MRLLPCMRAQDEDEDHSKHIDREIKQWIKNYNDAIKLLLLGTGESGKTTIIKQMKILHIKGFNQSERIEKIKYIRHNVHESIHDIVRNMARLSIALASPKNVQAQAFVLRCGPEGPPQYNEEYFDYVRALWRDAGVKECFKRSNEYQLIDSAEYFLDRIDLIEKSDYVPSDADILRCRQKTSGIQKIEFKVKVPKSMQGGVQDFWMFDVGGQRGERKKWIQVFEGIHAIWFLVACSDYDQTLREDGATNRLQEALTLFEDVWQSRFLLEAGLIVFLNKQDLLRQKVERGPGIARYFPKYRDYQGPGDEYDRTKMFIRQMFVVSCLYYRFIDNYLMHFSPNDWDHNPARKYKRAPPAAADPFVVAQMRARECSPTTATDNNVRAVFPTHQLSRTCSQHRRY